MVELPVSEFLDEVEPGGYRLAGTRVSLDTIAWCLLQGETVEEILNNFPAIRSREQLEGAIAFIMAHARELIEYVADGERLGEEIRIMNPPSPKSQSE